MQELKHWESFYVIVGSAVGALIGLQFVVMTLIAERPPPRAAEAVFIVARRMRQTSYEPDRDDWIFNVAAPFVGYSVLGVSGLCASSNERDALFGVATAALMLLFTGIRNSWDAISYLALVRRAKEQEKR